MINADSLYIDIKLIIFFYFEVLFFSTFVWCTIPLYHDKVNINETGLRSYYHVGQMILASSMDNIG